MPEAHSTLVLECMVPHMLCMSHHKQSKVEKNHLGRHLHWQATITVLPMQLAAVHLTRSRGHKESSTVIGMKNGRALIGTI